MSRLDTNQYMTRRREWALRLKQTLATLLVFLLGGVLPAQAEWYQRSGAVMGTEVSIDVWHTNATVANHAVDEAFNELQRIDNLLSPYKSESVLSRINHDSAESPVPVSDEIFGLIKTALEISALSEGAFDISYASVGYHYDYRTQQRPAVETVKKSLPLINWELIVLDEKEKSVFFLRQGLRVDLGGIAKGYAVDRAVTKLQKTGILHARIQAGGDTRILGDKQGRPWYIGIKNPRASGYQIVLPLADVAVSTSGDYERFFIEEGVRHHHIINPRTGYAAEDVRSVTVIGARGVMTDALSTAVFVAGPEKGMALINQLADYSAVIIDSDNKVHYSADLALH